jgi:hypothetical protein
MTEMRAASAARDFRAGHPVARVLFGVDIVLADRFEEARPAGAGIELGIGIE